MKKAFLYVFSAVVLGVGIMLFPLWTFFRSYNEEGPIVFSDSVPQFKPMTASENWENYTQTRTEDIPDFGGSKVQPQPRATDASLQILAVGFVAAFVAYAIVRRRAPRPAYRLLPY